MRSKLCIIALIPLMFLTACNRTQVGLLLHKPAAEVTAQELATANKVDRLLHPTPSSAFVRLASGLHNHPFLACTRAHESNTAGGYQAFNPQGPWLGAYQFLQSTWNSTASHAGAHSLIGVDPRQAGVFAQDLMAMHLFLWQGKAPWGGRC